MEVPDYFQTSRTIYRLKRRLSQKDAVSDTALIRCRVTSSVSELKQNLGGQKSKDCSEVETAVRRWLMTQDTGRWKQL